MPNQLRRDPSRTTLLQKRFVADMVRRFKSLAKEIEKLIIKDDAFGLTDSTLIQFNVEQQVWRFQTNPQKVRSFRVWLGKQVRAGILTVEPGFESRPWTAPYIDSAYKKGVVRSYTEVNKANLLGKPESFLDSKQQFLNQTFAASETTQKIELLYERAFTELEGVTSTMDQQLSRILASGLSEGRSPRQIARTMVQQVTKLTNVRAKAIARTEIIRSHAEGQLDSFERLGVKELKLLAEWQTAGDERVCPECEQLEGVVMTVDEARGLLPRHPNCRCIWLPAEKNRFEVGQLRGKKAGQAIDRSIRAEGGLTKAGRFRKSLKESRSSSVWAGKLI